MNKIYEGYLTDTDLSIGIVASRFNQLITQALIEGAKDALIRHGVKTEKIDMAWVPGAFEIPQVAQKLAKTKKYDAIITLGAIIKGETPHFELVCQAASKGVIDASLESDVPVIFGVLTTHTIEQAIERAGTKAGNQGWHVAISAIEMANLQKQLMVAESS